MVGWCSFILLWTYVDVHPFVNLFLWFTLLATAGGCAFFLWTSIEVHSPLGYGGGLFPPVNIGCPFFTWTVVKIQVHGNICGCPFFRWRSVDFLSPCVQLLMFIGHVISCCFCSMGTFIDVHFLVYICCCSFLTEHWLLFIPCWTLINILSLREHRVFMWTSFDVHSSREHILHGSICCSWFRSLVGDVHYARVHRLELIFIWTSVDVHSSGEWLLRPILHENIGGCSSFTWSSVRFMFRRSPMVVLGAFFGAIFIEVHSSHGLLWLFILLGDTCWCPFYRGTSVVVHWSGWHWLMVNFYLVFDGRSVFTGASVDAHASGGLWLMFILHVDIVGGSASGSHPWRCSCQRLVG